MELQANKQKIITDELKSFVLVMSFVINFINKLLILKVRKICLLFSIFY